MSGEGRTAVLIAAGGSGWEGEAVAALTQAGVVVLKRCVDLADVLASAQSGQAQIALVSGSLPGLDADAVVQLLRSEVRTVAVEETGRTGETERLARIGVVATVGPAPEQVVSAVGDAVRAHLVADPAPVQAEEPLPERPQGGRRVVVWGPTGAPGRTTVAVGMAAQRAHTHPTVLIDADCYGGAVAQHLGILDEVSGMLAAARLVNAGTLDASSFAATRRRVGDRLDVLTGLPRPDRWVEVRAGVLPVLVDGAAEVGDVVVDTGFCLEEDAGGRPVGRNQMTLDVLAEADEVVLVGTAEPTGLSRLARAVVEIGEVAPAVALRVVVNRMRDSLGWSRHDVLGMIEGYVRPLGVHFLPHDPGPLDRALVLGRALAEIAPDAPLGKAIAELTDATFDGGGASVRQPGG